MGSRNHLDPSKNYSSRNMLTLVLFGKLHPSCYQERENNPFVRINEFRQSDPVELELPSPGVGRKTPKILQGCTRAWTPCLRKCVASQAHKVRFWRRHILKRKSPLLQCFGGASLFEESHVLLAFSSTILQEPGRCRSGCHEHSSHLLRRRPTVNMTPENAWLGDNYCNGRQTNKWGWRAAQECPRTTL